MEPPGFREVAAAILMTLECVVLWSILIWLPYRRRFREVDRLTRELHSRIRKLGDGVSPGGKYHSDTLGPQLQKSLDEWMAK